jgi:hypothetical protein
LLRDSHGFRAPVTLAQYREFIASLPGDKEICSRQEYKSAAYLDEDGIACEVPECVVNRLEPVKIEQDQSELLAIDGRQRVKFRDQTASVGKAGQ